MQQEACTADLRAWKRWVGGARLADGEQRGLAAAARARGLDVAQAEEEADLAHRLRRPSQALVTASPCSWQADPCDQQWYEP